MNQVGALTKVGALTIVSSKHFLRTIFLNETFWLISKNYSNKIFSLKRVHISIFVPKKP